MHDPATRIGSEIRIKFQPSMGIEDARRRLDLLKAEGKLIPRSPFGQRCAREALIEKWHARYPTLAKKRVFRKRKKARD
jgi:hypothetical protein